MKQNIIAVALSALCLVACAQDPNTISLNPKVNAHANKVYDDLNAKISVYDLRSTAHIVEVLSADRPSTLISSADSLKDVLNSEFSDQLALQGLKLNNGSDLQVQFQVERARTYVNQDVLDYRANTIIKLRVKVENPAQTLSKTFTLRATTRGALSADIDELQKDFNVQLAKLIIQVVEDEQLQQFIKG
ncbi:YajG family lipoprotein [Thalassotalea sp. Y01]|uniref:YajG family lipoprotein n=1 Tax=Thalassotalea sp. Y01 TaxID=2729613 RepID=UPI00145E6B69|nr:YajG family lipoprotein [Thalassotalea sp. Y01]NMP17890.1 hypothetical protein [Thalassotalea sp. Y01]